MFYTPPLLIIPVPCFISGILHGLSHQAYLITLLLVSDITQ